MAITISGENNNDRILASDGVIDQISGINFSGIITASHINVGSNIQLGNAGIITATTFVGNVTGNVNSTSPLLLQTGGSERFRITGNNELGIAGGNYGSAGQVLTSGGSGNAVTWSTIPTQVTISGNADNRVITGGSGVNLNGEANLTFSGSTLKVNSTTGHSYLKLNSNDNYSGSIHFGDQSDDDAAQIWYDNYQGNGLYLRTSENTPISFYTNGSQRLHISSDGPHLLLGGTSDVNEITETSSNAGIVIGGTGFGNGGLAIINSTSGTGRIYFGDAVGGNAARQRGQINYYHSSDYMMFATAGTERFRIDSSGQITNTGIATSFVTTNFAANFAKLDIRGTNIANSNHYILSYGEGHANDHEFHMVNTLGEIVFRTGSGSDTDRLRIDTSGRISNNSRVATDFGSPNLLISGTNSMFTMMGDGSINNSSYTGIKFRVAGASTGDYTKAGIFVVRQDGYNDLDMLFCFNKDANATGVTDGDEKVRITSDGILQLSTNKTSGYVAEFNQTNTSNSAQIKINSPTDSNSRPSLIDFARAGTVKWSAGMGYNDSYNGFHISAGSLSANISNSKFVVTSDGYTGIGNYAGAGTDPVTSLLHVATNWDNGDVPMVHFKGCNNEAPSSGSTNISFQITDENDNVLHKVWNTGGGNTDLGKVYYAGRLLIGTTTANSTGSYSSVVSTGAVSDNGGFQVHYNSGTQGGGSMTTVNAAGGGLDFWTYTGGLGSESYAKRLRIDGSTGDIMCYYYQSLFSQTGLRIYNNLSGGPQLAISRSSGYPMLLNRNTTDGTILELRRGWGAGGSISVGTNSATYNTSSDYRLKENIVAISDGITRLKTLKPSRFNWIGDTSSTRDGFIAHEVTAVPEAITGTKDEVYTEDQPSLNIKAGDPKYQGIDQARLVPLLTAALQEAIAKIETLEIKVATLEGS